VETRRSLRKNADRRISSPHWAGRHSAGVIPSPAAAPRAGSGSAMLSGPGERSAL